MEADSDLFRKSPRDRGDPTEMMGKQIMQMPLARPNHAHPAPAGTTRPAYVDPVPGLVVALVAALLLPVSNRTAPVAAADLDGSSTETIYRQDGSWPQFRGPTGDGQTSTHLPLTWSESEHIRWKTPIHDRGWSSPVVFEDQVWMTTATADGKKLYAVCVDLNSGELLHDRQLFDVDEPQEIHLTNSYASCTPVVERDRVYIHFGSYGTACLNSRTGELIWQRRDLPCDHFRGPGSSPILFNDLLIIHYDGFDFQYVVALDKTSGRTVWRRDREVAYGTDDGDLMKAYCTPLVIRVDGNWQLISPTSKATIAYDPATGAEIWRVRYDEFSATARPLFGDGLVFINTGFSKAKLLAVRPTGTGDLTEQVVWIEDRSVGSKPSAVLAGHWIFGVHDRGVATCWDQNTGQQLWAERLGGNYSASLLCDGDRLFLFDEEGTGNVIQVGPQFELISSNQLDDGCMASPAAVDGSLLVRTRTHLYRIADDD